MEPKTEVLGVLTATILNRSDAVSQSVLCASPDGQDDVRNEYDSSSRSTDYHTHTPAMEMEETSFSLSAKLRRRDTLRADSRRFK